MYKFILAFGLLSVNQLFAQSLTTPNTTIDTAAVNKDDAPSSNVVVNIGLSNSAFSQNNKSLSAAAQVQKLFTIPSVTYNHKSGLSLATTTYLDLQAGTKNPFQYSLSPSYEYNRSKDFAFGAAYTSYFGRDTTSKYSSPYQHEITAFYTNKESWLRWGFSADFATGKSTEHYSKDSVITTSAGKRTIKLSATGNSKTTDFIFSANVAHEFIGHNVFTGDDNLSFLPTFMLNAGSSNYYAVYTGDLNSFALVELSKRKNVRTVSGSDNVPFKLQSAALSSTLTYEIGNFSITPEFYLEYLLPKDESKFLYVFTIGLAYTFY